MVWCSVVRCGVSLSKEEWLPSTLRCCKFLTWYVGCGMSWRGVVWRGVAAWEVYVVRCEVIWSEGVSCGVVRCGG